MFFDTFAIIYHQAEFEPVVSYWSGMIQASRLVSAHLHLQMNGRVINDTRVTFNSAPFSAGRAKKNTS
jgi:hypothetical protein